MHKCTWNFFTWNSVTFSYEPNYITYFSADATIDSLAIDLCSNSNLIQSNLWAGGQCFLPPPQTPSTHFSEEQKGKRETEGKKRVSKQKLSKRLWLKSKCYCVSHSRASRTQNSFLPANHGGCGWQYFFSVSWPLHFAINFAGLEFMLVFKL